MEQYTPKEIVKELDKFIIGQESAKKAVAVALRNRYRRSKLSEELKEEITPKNILMKGPTGVGKTEIARRLAKIVGAPFIKVEATKFTEVGYVGRDVESMIRDLTEVSVRLVKTERLKKLEKSIKEIVDKILLDALYVSKKSKLKEGEEFNKDIIKEDFENGKCEEDLVEIEVREIPKQNPMAGAMGIEVNLTDMFGSILPPKKKRKTLAVKDAREALTLDESDKRLDQDDVNDEAIRKVEQEGIVFIDEIDKIISGEGTRKGNGPEVSREGVQRDILPIVEGSSVNTKYGVVKTNHILFIAAGAFHISRFDDLIPELQGRFPIRVTLNNLTKEDFLEILTKPQNALITQYKELLKVDNINLIFEDSALEEIALIAERENETSENIGARRLHTLIEELLQEISFNAGSNSSMVDVKINKEYVDNIFNSSIKSYNLNKYLI